MFSSGSTAVKPEGYVSSPDESTETRVAIVSPNYLHTMQVPLVKGGTLRTMIRKIHNLWRL